MDLIPGYPNYLDTGYQFPDTVSPDTHDTPVTQAPGPPQATGGDRQRSLSGDRVVILPRRASESEPEWSPGPPGPPGPQPGPHGHHDRLRHPAAAGPGVAPEWRVPPHYPPESLYPGKR